MLPGVRELLVKLAPFAFIRTVAITTEQVVDLAQVFEISMSAATAEAIAKNAPRFATNPKESLLEFILNGGWLKMIAGQQPVKRGDLIRRCGQCEGLIIPPPE